MFQFDSKSKIPLFKQLLNHSEEKTAYAITTYYGGSFIYNALVNTKCWDEGFRGELIEEYIAHYGTSEPSMENYLKDCKNDLWLTE
jgi:hypothetical protein